MGSVDCPSETLSRRPFYAVPPSAPKFLLRYRGPEATLVKISEYALILAINNFERMFPSISTSISPPCLASETEQCFMYVEITPDARHIQRLAGGKDGQASVEGKMSWVGMGMSPVGGAWPAALTWQTQLFGQEGASAVHVDRGRRPTARRPYAHCTLISSHQKKANTAEAPHTMRTFEDIAQLYLPAMSICVSPQTDRTHPQSHEHRNALPSILSVQRRRTVQGKTRSLFKPGKDSGIFSHALKRLTSSRRASIKRLAPSFENVRIKRWSKIDPPTPRRVASAHGELSHSEDVDIAKLSKQPMSAPSNCQAGSNIRGFGRGRNTRSCCRERTYAYRWTPFELHHPNQWIGATIDVSANVPEIYGTRPATSYTISGKTEHISIRGGGRRLMEKEERDIRNQAKRNAAALLRCNVTQWVLSISTWASEIKDAWLWKLHIVRRST
ncbi:hypothetical protein DFP72DRAFT_1138612 [Ephemerocybe angulata]|uniref:Uncharacterized protein n=1 Tax=Ephemerocybe angulata TaxID=980116 RepID=A0A8H6HQA5_9AGAR|nr:hypothetical protein DFP72DRAFT_1138612 [Tulosesus angulatus]